MRTTVKNYENESECMWHTHTWEQRVLYAEHGWSVPIRHGLHDLLFGDVRAAVLDANPRFQVVEVAAVQLEEFDQQHAQILVGVPGIDARMELKRKQNKYYNTLCGHYTAIKASLRPTVPAGSWWPWGWGCTSWSPRWRPRSDLSAAETASGRRSGKAARDTSESGRRDRREDGWFSQTVD